MYERFMTLIEKNADKIMKDVIREVEKREETRHYWEISEALTEDRVAQVIRNVHVRLGSWLNKNKPKNTLFAYYSDLGAHRCREGIPLDEVVMVFQLIKRAIWHELREQIAVDNGFNLNQFMEINYYVNLFFDRIIHALVNGYQEELKTLVDNPWKEEHLLAMIFKKEHEIDRKRKRKAC